MPPSRAAGDAPAHRGEHNGRQDVQEVGEGRKEGRRQAGRCEGGQTAQDGAEVAVPQGRKAGPPRRRQPADREGRRRRPRAGLHRGHAGLETGTSGAASTRSSVRTVPGVHKAVKWNSPLYGVEGQGWFLGIHCFTNYVKVAFFRGTSLRPVPPGESKSKNTRYLDIHEDDPLDEAQLAAWVKLASQLPSERM